MAKKEKVCLTLLDHYCIKHLIRIWLHKHALGKFIAINVYHLMLELNSIDIINKINYLNILHNLCNKIATMYLFG